MYNIKTEIRIRQNMARNTITVVQVENNGAFVGHMTAKASDIFDQILAQTNIGKSKLISMLGLTHNKIVGEDIVMNLVEDLNNRSRRGY